MRCFTSIIAVLALAACGGKKKPAPVQPEAKVPAAPPAKTEPEPPPAPPPPPPPKVMKAKADLTPLKGQKFKAAGVTITQKEGETTAQVTSTGWFDGLKAGKYHLVVHAGTDCTKPGAAFAGAATPIDFTAEKGTGNIDASGVAMQVEGDQTVTGHVLVLTDDKRGKPGKTLACGPIATLDGD